MAPIWPASLPAPSVGTTEALSHPAIRHDFEAGYVMTRPRNSRPRRRMALKWSYLTEDQYEDLEDFFVQAQGQAFSFTHPRTGTVLSVVIMSDELPGGFEAPGGRTNVTLEIAER